MTSKRSLSFSGFLRSTVALRMIRILILLLMLASIPILFVYHDQMSKTYGASANANPPPISTVPTPSDSTNTTSTSIPQSSTWISTTLWSTMQPVDFIYLILTILTLFLHVHPTRPFFRGSQVVNLCVLIFLAYVWVILSIIWFTDLTWKDYDPHLYPSPSLQGSVTATVTATATATASVIAGVPGAVIGYTLFPSQEPTIISSFAPTKATATFTATPTPTSTVSTSVSHEVQWAAQCHTPSGLETTQCELMMAYHVLGCFIGSAMILEGIMSWFINMKEESVEQRLKRLQAKDDAKAVKVAKRTKRVQREMQALDNSRPVIQGPMIG